MPIVRNVSRAVSQLLQSPACGCGVSIVPVRCIGISPRQVASDASFHSVSFSESDHPRVLITGQHSYRNCMPAPGIPHSPPFSPLSRIMGAKIFRAKNNKKLSGIFMVPCESPMCRGGGLDAIISTRGPFQHLQYRDSVHLLPIFIPEIY